MTVKFPNSATLEEAVLNAIKEIGGVANTNQIDELATKQLNLTQEQITEIQSGGRTEIKYRLAWVRTKAKNRGLIEKTANGAWKIIEQAR